MTTETKTPTDASATPPSPAGTGGQAAKGKESNPVRSITGMSFLLIALLFLWYVAADRLTPWTDQARVKGFVVPVASKVAGRVEQVHVTRDQVVDAGDPLIRIDPRDYEVAVQRAEAALELAGQEIGAGTDAVASAEARVAEARSQVEYARQQAKRYADLAKKGIISKADSDKVRNELKKAEAQARSAQAELDRAKEQLGAEGRDNARIRDAVAALEQARYDLEATEVRAPGLGGVTNLQVDEGYYANVGQPLMTFVSFDDVWVEAHLRENSIAHVEPGNRVEIALDVAPGRVFRGRVESLGFAVDDPTQGGMGELLTVKSSSGWLRDAQRFPVVIRFTDAAAKGLRRVGGQADVQVYTGDHAMLNALGWFWIRLMSWLSYVY